VHPVATVPPQGTVTFGRDSDNDVVLDDLWVHGVSRTHAILQDCENPDIIDPSV
jgi:pSer/pThr/pTyr-binding forkhead associated (FHA) protein